jgi:hypothetical protein
MKEGANRSVMAQTPQDQKTSRFDVMPFFLWGANDASVENRGWCLAKGVLTNRA